MKINLPAVNVSVDVHERSTDRTTSTKTRAKTTKINRSVQSPRTARTTAWPAIKLWGTNETACHTCVRVAPGKTTPLPYEYYSWNFERTTTRCSFELQNTFVGKHCYLRANGSPTLL